MVGKKRVGILYICTGKYNQFFMDFYHSCEQFLLRDYLKTYYVWTDDTAITGVGDRIIVFHKDCQGFPYDSLFRFDMFLQAFDLLEKEDYLFYFNSNAEFRSEVNEEILPDESGLTAALWPGKRMRQSPMLYPYERNKRSLAYIPPFHPPYKYFMGGLNGGTACEYLKMVRVLADNIREDYDNGIIAVVHDESHLNAYLHNHPCRIMGPEYCWPEEWKTEMHPKMVFRDKVILDPFFDKGRDRSLWGLVKKGFMIIAKAISWFL